MAARIARNNGNTNLTHPTDGQPVLDWNGGLIVPGALVVVDDESNRILDTVTAGLLELDPTTGRHYEAGPTERKVRPTP